jgi:hypothetical protein
LNPTTCHFRGFCPGRPRVYEVEELEAGCIPIQPKGALDVGCGSAANGFKREPNQLRVALIFLQPEAMSVEKQIREEDGGVGAEVMETAPLIRSDEPLIQ